MRDIYYSTVFLASPDPALGAVGPSAMAFNGQQVVDDAAFLQATARAFFGRGQKSCELRFRVVRAFSSVRALQAFILTHLNELPTQGDLQLTIGTVDDTAVLTLEDAVFVSCNVVAILGVSAVVEYTFRGGMFTTEEVTLPDESSLVKTKIVTLTPGDTSQAVTYDAPFGAIPKFISGVIAPPDGGKAFAAYPRESTRTAEGITFDFDAAVPASGTYKLLVQACL